MIRKRRKVPNINATSTADISFMLLIFFLVTTSMNTDEGLSRRLPPPMEEEFQKEDIQVKERNILMIKINKFDELMVNGEICDITQLKEKAKKFISNVGNDPKMPEKHMKTIPLMGEVQVTDKHVISVQNDVGTSYNTYIQVQNELVAAYNELRNELALSRFGRSFKGCTKEQQKAIIDYYPQKISEAEPKYQ